MADPRVPDSVRKTFAELTGELEDLALIAAEAQAVHTVDEARHRCEVLMAALDPMLLRLRRLKETLR